MEYFLGQIQFLTTRFKMGLHCNICTTKLFEDIVIILNPSDYGKQTTMQVKALMNDFGESSRLDFNVVQPSFPQNGMYAVLLSIINNFNISIVIVKIHCFPFGVQWQGEKGLCHLKLHFYFFNFSFGGNLVKLQAKMGLCEHKT